MNYPKTLKNLIESYKKLPGIGEKSAERLSLATLELSEEQIELFSQALKDTKIKIRKCERCNNLSEEELCEICVDENRKKDIICVVDEPKNVFAFEKLGIYFGQYHVINGLISPSDGIGPDEVDINKLIRRIHDEKISELILALKPSIEGETTSLYIAKRLSGEGVLISKIAHGIPLGADMDYVDSLTLEMALESRKKIS